MKWLDQLFASHTRAIINLFLDIYIFLPQVRTDFKVFDFVLTDLRISVRLLLLIFDIELGFMGIVQGKNPKENWL